MSKTKCFAFALALAAGAAMAGSALAHHSFAMFDNQKVVILNGTVKEFQWGNPHSWVQLMVRDPVTGQDTEWSIEGASPNTLGRKGWKGSSLKPGDKVAVAIHPLKNHTEGGSLVSVTVNGVTLTTE